jgi:hypothetical protein
VLLEEILRGVEVVEIPVVERDGCQRSSTSTKGGRHELFELDDLTAAGEDTKLRGEGRGWHAEPPGVDGVGRHTVVTEDDAAAHQGSLRLLGADRDQQVVVGVVAFEGLRAQVLYC